MKKEIKDNNICRKCNHNDKHIMIECGYNDIKYAFCDKFDNVVDVKSECKFYKSSGINQYNEHDAMNEKSESEFVNEDLFTDDIEAEDYDDGNEEDCGDNEHNKKEFDEERFDALVEALANKIESEKRNGMHR